MNARLCAHARVRYGFCKELNIIVIAMCGMKLEDKKMTKDVKQIFDLEETIIIWYAIGVHWYGNALGKYDNNIL